MIKPFLIGSYINGDILESFNKRVSVFIDGVFDDWFNKDEYKNAEYRVLVSGCEPPEVYKNIYTDQDVINNQNKFDLILAASPTIIKHCSNAVKFPCGSHWARPIPSDITKRPILSFLCGTKQWLPGHQLRHEILRNSNLITNHTLTNSFHLSYNGDKEDLLYPAMFSIIVENSQHENYFSEKILDCFVSKSIPLYWGCPNIDDYFDRRAIAKFDTLHDLILKCNTLTPDIYFSKLDIIEKNFNTALQYNDFATRLSAEISRRISS
jgi:hypothetical protein